MIRSFIKILLVLSFYWTVSFSYAANALLLNVNGAISPATKDYIERGLALAQKQQAKLVILQLNTPGGLETSMRAINQAILTSSVPVVTYVAPSGARAASAGTFILYASHIAAMAPGTNIGAASPVAVGVEASSTMEKKAMNDASAYIRSLAELRHRNSAWGEQAVRSAVSLSAEEALRLKVIDLIAEDRPSLLKNINGRTVNLQGAEQRLQIAQLTITEVAPDWRYQFLAFITDPSVAYVLLLVGIYGLFFELYNPGFVLPGVAGAISILVALYAFQLLPINYAGFALILLGIVFMIIEVFVASFGVIGVGGVVAFIVGSIFLLDTNVPGFNIAWQIIALMGATTALFFFVLIQLTVRSFRKKVVSGREALVGATAEVVSLQDSHCVVRVHGELWNARTNQTLQLGQRVQVTAVSGLWLMVEKKGE